MAGDNIDDEEQKRKASQVVGDDEEQMGGEVHRSILPSASHIFFSHTLFTLQCRYLN